MNKRAQGARRPLQGAIALVLALGSNAAMALGLGDIRVLSQPGQPLLAEIPVVSADPGELEAAKVALASPATFARVGLERPSGLISALQFDFAQDAQGRAVIRVRSATPVDVPVVSFLIEVDWGRGRLVREYSALVDRPHTAAAIQAPQIQAPSLAPSNTIVREPGAAAPVALAPMPPAPAPGGAPTLAVAAAPRPTAAAAPALPPSGVIAVQAGQTLSQIASDVARGSQANLEQAMVALLQANPQAFIGGNIHRLRSGAQLQLPDAQALAGVGAAQARAIVREQTGQWQQARRPLPQPAVAPPATAPATPAAAPVAAVQASGARLEIAPAVAVDEAATASVSGTEAGAQGDMLVSEQLRQAREDLATRDAELAELRERVAELEKLREQQSALIALKDNEMAAAQKQAADSNADTPSEAGAAAWIWGGGLLLLGAAFAAWLARRRKPRALPPLSASAVAEQPLDQPAVADAAPERVDAEQLISALQATSGQPASTPEPPQAAQIDDAPAMPAAAAPLQVLPLPAQDVAVAGPEVPDTDLPSAADVTEDLAAKPPVNQPVNPPLRPDVVFDPFQLPANERELPMTDATLADDRLLPAHGDGQSPPAGLPVPGSRERLELAIAYLDLGDADTARTLLEEVAAAGDSTARDQAVELLGRLG